jgi:outer membrane receptor protein involved in Fe transport
MIDPTPCSRRFTPDRPRSFRGGRAAVAGFLAVGVFAAALTAQTVETSEDTVVLSPFQVSTERDYGYVATTSLAGGRLATDLSATPAQITVFTRDFLDDIGASTYSDVINWAPNSFNISEAGITPGDNLFNEIRVSFRGLGGTFATRNYFKSYVNLDSYSTERVDFARGPNSIVYGDSGVGGIANVSSKVAYDGSLTQLHLRFSDWDGVRGALDLNRALGDRVFLRVGTLYDKSDGWREREDTTRTGLFANLAIKPWEGGMIRLEGETGKISRNLGFVMLDGFSFWDTTTSTNLTAPQTSGNFGGGVGRFGRAQTFIFNPGVPDAGVQNYFGYGQTNSWGTLPQLRPGVPVPGGNNTLTPVPSLAFNMNARGAESVQDYDIYTLSFEQRIGDNLFLELAGNVTESWRTVDQVFWDTIRVDVNRNMPDGRPNPRFGEYYADQGRVRQFYQGNDVWDARLSLAYLLDTDLTKQSLLALYGKRSDDFSRTDTELLRVGGANPNLTANVNFIGIRRYVNDRDQRYVRPEVGTPVAGGGTVGWVPTQGSYNNSEVEYLQLAASGTWLESERLHTLVGWRRDELARQGGGVLRETGTNAVIGWGPSSRDIDYAVNSVTGGVVVDVTSVLSVFANYAESFRDPSNAVLIDGSAAGAVFSDGTDFGVRFNAFEGRFIGSVGYYKNEETSPYNPGLTNNINNIWLDLNSNESVPTGYNDRRTFQGDGWELELNFTPTRNWRVMFNYSRPDTQLLSDLVDTEAYVAANRATWISGANGLDASDPAAAARIRSNLQLLDQRLEGAERGRPLNGSLKHTANLFTNYFFTEGRMKGFNFGGGVNFRGARLVTNRPGNAFDLVYAKGFATFNLTAGYRTKIMDKPVRFQLNVSNLFDDQFIRPERYSTYAIGGVNEFLPDRWAITPPRRIQFTTTIDF